MGGGGLREGNKYQKVRRETRQRREATDWDAGGGGGEAGIAEQPFRPKKFWINPRRQSLDVVQLRLRTNREYKSDRALTGIIRCKESSLLDAKRSLQATFSVRLSDSRL